MICVKSTKRNLTRAVLGITDKVHIAYGERGKGAASLQWVSWQPHYPLYYYTNVTFHDFIILIPDLVAFSQALQGGKSEGDKEEKKDEKKDDKDDKKKDEPGRDELRFDHFPQYWSFAFNAPSNYNPIESSFYKTELLQGWSVLH